MIPTNRQMENSSLDVKEKLTINWAAETYAAVVELPPLGSDQIEVLNFADGSPEPKGTKAPYTIGRYDEIRSGLYEGSRTLHMGVDIGAPAKTPIYHFFDGKILAVVDLRGKPKDFGILVITEHQIDHQTVFAAYGHVDPEALQSLQVDQQFGRGTLLGRIASKEDNGGWNPHLHFQLSLVHPLEPHLIVGVVDPKERQQALAIYPDPRVVLGDIY